MMIVDWSMELQKEEMKSPLWMFSSMKSSIIDGWSSSVGFLGQQKELFIPFGADIEQVFLNSAVQESNDDHDEIAFISSMI